MRSSFLFRREYYDYTEAIQDNKEKLSVMYAIVKYGIEEKETYPYEKHSEFLSKVYMQIDSDFKTYQRRRGLN